MIAFSRLVVFLILLLVLFAVPVKDYAYAENTTSVEGERGFATLETQKNKPVSILDKEFAIAHYSDNIAKNDSTASKLTLNFNREEQEYLSKIDFIPICVDPDWMPYEKLDEDGNYLGLVADYMKIIFNSIGKEFRVVKTSSWDESLSVARQRGCDILPGAVPTPLRKEFLNFSEPYIFLPLVIATNLEEIFILDFKEVADKSFALIEGYAAIELLHKKYPNIVIKEVPDSRTGLAMVRQKKVYGYIDTLPTISYQLKTNRMPNLKISGELDLDYDVSIAVRNDRPLLLSIINKAIAKISYEERQKIFYNWISVSYDRGIDYELVGKIVAASLVFLSLLFYRNLIISRYNKRLIEANKKLDFLYKTDKLTGLFNRHIIDEEIEKEVFRANQYNLTFSVVLMDVDYFKQINDTYGHHVGDSVLMEVAFILKNNLRKTDLIGRWGGEEFIVVCPETQLTNATHLAEKLRSKIEEHQFSDVEKTITASFGVSAYRIDDTVESLIKRVDSALYFSKRNNRNCVTFRD
ncbi:diguanylate cyclase [Aerosakkonemataceae cyanobacterium BLCC-F154]|uniref:Diguanylate cyclase n=1 Tax=Floridaenema fluviatile BLCC-F154 TaxID=3153640 RepID=A0ABV4Y9B9_9CYAN